VGSREEYRYRLAFIRVRSYTLRIHIVYLSDTSLAVASRPCRRSSAVGAPPRKKRRLSTSADFSHGVMNDMGPDVHSAYAQEWSLQNKHDAYAPERNCDTPYLYIPRPAREHEHGFSCRVSPRNELSSPVVLVFVTRAVGRG
jgi:hypothetical protein